MPEKRVACGTLVKWDKTPPADIPSASWAAIGFVQTMTAPGRARGGVDISELGTCEAEEAPGVAEITEFTFTIFEDSADTLITELEAAFDAKTKAAWQIIDPHGAPNNPYQAFFGWISAITPQTRDQTGAITSQVTVRKSSGITRGTLGP